MTTLRQLALEVLARHPGEYVKGADITAAIRAEHHGWSSLGTCVGKYLRAEARYGTVERRAVPHRYTEWRLVQ